MTVFVAILLTALGQSEAACPAPVDVRTFTQTISTADGAYNDMDLTAFHAARSEALSALSCLQEPLGSAQVAALYRMQALGAFVDRDRAAGVTYFRGLLAVAPGYVLSDSVAPAGHPMRRWFEEALTQPPGPTLPLGAPSRGWVQIDGRAAETRPTDRPYIIQVMNADGGVVSTTLVPPGQAPPAYTTGAPSLIARSSRPEPRPARPPADDGARVNKPLLATAGVSALAAGGLYLAAAQRESQFFDLSTPNDELATLQRQTNTLAGLSLGVGAVAGASCAAAFFVGTW